MKRFTGYRGAYTSACLIIGLLGIGNVLDKSAETSWMTVPIFFAVVFLIGFNAYMTMKGGEK